MRYGTKKEATEALVNGFNFIPEWMMQKLYPYGEEVEVLNSYPYSEDDECYSEQEEYEHYCWNCTWGTYFNPRNIVDIEKIKNMANEVGELGFKVLYDYENDELYLGINGAGYDFYEAHWIPLYELLGYKWHDEE